jgi:hypothetical protein
MGQGSLFLGTRFGTPDGRRLDGVPSQPYSPRSQHGQEDKVDGRTFSSNRTNNSYDSRIQTTQQRREAELDHQVRQPNGMHSPRSPTGQERNSTQQFRQSFSSAYVRRNLNDDMEIDDEDDRQRAMEEEQDRETRRIIERMRTEDARSAHSIDDSLESSDQRNGNSWRNRDLKGKQRASGNLIFPFTSSNERHSVGCSSLQIECLLNPF